MRRLTWMIAGVVALAGCETGTAVPEALGTSDGQPLVVSLRDDLRLAVPRAGDAFRVQLESSSGDTTYRTTWTLATGTCLRVVPRAGDTVVIQGAPIVSDYYHVGRVLGVAVGPQGNQQLYSFVEPISFQTIPCPTAAAAAP